MNSLDGSTAFKSLRDVPFHRSTPPVKPALPSTCPAIGVVMKRNKMASMILAHVLHEGSKQPIASNSRLGPTTPALVAACIRMKKSGRRSTPKAAMKVITEPANAKQTVNHINISVLLILCSAALYKCGEGDGRQKSDQRNAKHDVKECDRSC